MKKKIVLVFFCALVLASSVLAVASSAAATSTQVAWLSNRVTAPSSDSPVGYRMYFTLIQPSYDFTRSTDLEPNTMYYINDTPFVTNSLGQIPDGVTFVAWNVLWVINRTMDQPVGSPMYQYYTISVANTDPPQYYDRSHNSNFAIVASDNSDDAAVEAAYNAGRADGAIEGRRLGFDEGYTAGYRDGDLDGYQRGLEIAENGSWYNLFYSVVDAPVAVLQSLFDVEILGFNLSSAIGGILTLCVVIIVVKAVI